MTWWCAATGNPWAWTWRPYPGVWLFIALVAGAYVALWRSRGPRLSVEGWSARHAAAFAAGTLMLWIALDWPVGALGSGYLASVHTVQYLLLSLIAPPLLLLGIPGDFWLRLDRNTGAFTWARRCAGPLLGLVVYNAIIVATHIPAVVDALMASQLGSLVVDLSWIVAGLFLWWPVLAPPGVGRMRALLQIGYLFAATIIPTVPAMMMVYADYPLYALYENAPRIAGFAAKDDQQLGGLLMKLAADPIIWVAMAVIFFRWSGEQSRVDQDAPQEPARK